MATRKNHHDRPSFLYLGRGERNTPVITSDETAFEMEQSDVWNCVSGYNFPSSEPKKNILHSSKFSRKPLKVRTTDDHNVHERSITGKSLPVNVPDWSKILQGEYKNGRREKDDDVDIFYDDNDDEDDRLPPHEYLARTRIASFSVHEGVGRTLKGRDLSRVRNAIWKQTGFED